MKKTLAYFGLLSLLIAAGVSGESRGTFKKDSCLSPAAAQEYISAVPKQRDLRTRSTRTAVTPQGEILVVEVDSELLILPNPFDLEGRAIRFQPAPKNRYTYSVAPAFFNAQASDTVPLQDDDSRELIFQNFQFPFAGTLYDRCFINSNGNITFLRGDPDPPSIENISNGPPRIAPFFADLDPETIGTVYVNQGGDNVVITWLKVPEFFNQNQFDFGENTFQVVLYKDGRIDLVYSEEITATQALVGITPGEGKTPFRLVDFSKGTLRNRTLMSFLETFHDYESVDIPMLMRTVYASQRDHYDFVTLLSNFNLTPVPGAQAFAINVQNDVRGIGNPSGRGNAIFRDNRRYGSADKLENITFLGNLNEYPPDPERALPDLGMSMLQILAHEVSHRWLTYIRFPRNGQAEDVLLGRDRSHWSFFFNSEGSFLEGNKIQKRTSDSFLTGRPYQRFSELDLYLMGLSSPNEVRPSFVVEGASNFSPDFSFSSDSAPEADVSFRGTAIPVEIENVIAVNGQRKPDHLKSQKEFRHMFIVITKKENPLTSEELGVANQIRLRWEEYFRAATTGKATIRTYID